MSLKREKNIDNDDLNENNPAYIRKKRMLNAKRCAKEQIEMERLNKSKQKK